MSKVRVAGISVSLDGFSAGVEQSLRDPLGNRGTEIFQWYFPFAATNTAIPTRSPCEAAGIAPTDSFFVAEASQSTTCVSCRFACCSQ